MDFLAHGMWGYIFLQHKSKKWYLPFLAGLIPDTISWVPFFLSRLFTGIQFGRPNQFTIPAWVDVSYGIGHSLVTAAVVFLIIYLIFKKIPLFLYAWPIAIVMDLLTHTREMFPTPFLWPLSDWTFPGISWGTPWFMVLNWSLILVFVGYIHYTKWRKQKK